MLEWYSKQSDKQIQSWWGHLLHTLVIRSPNLTYTFLPDSEVCGLVCSLPLLEDVSLVARTPPRRNQWSSPPTPPQFIGSLAGGSICYPPFVRSPKWSTLQADSDVIVLRRTWWANDHDGFDGEVFWHPGISQHHEPLLRYVPCCVCLAETLSPCRHHDEPALQTHFTDSQQLPGVRHRNNLCIILCKYSPPEIR